MSNKASNDFWGYVITIGIFVIGFMWVFEIGPFEPTAPKQMPTNTLSAQRYSPSFTGSTSKVKSRTVKFYDREGSYCYGTYDLETDGYDEYFNGYLVHDASPSETDFLHYVSFASTYVYFN